MICLASIQLQKPADTQPVRTERGWEKVKARIKFLIIVIDILLVSLIIVHGINLLNGGWEIAYKKQKIHH